MTTTNAPALTETERQLIATVRELLKSFGRRNAAANRKAKDEACQIIWKLEGK